MAAGLREYAPKRIRTLGNWRRALAGLCRCRDGYRHPLAPGSLGLHERPRTYFWRGKIPHAEYDKYQCDDTADDHVLTHSDDSDNTRPIKVGTPRVHSTTDFVYYARK